MARPKAAKASDEQEVEVVLMRRVAPERFDVVTGVVIGTFIETTKLERNVSLMVGRGTARKAIDVQANARKAAIGLVVDS